MAQNNTRVIPDFKRLTKEDFPEEYRELMEKLAFPINSFFEDVRNLFNGNIGVENLTQQFVTLDIQTDASGSPINTLRFKTTIPTNRRICGMIAISATVINQTNTYLNQTPFVSFSQNADIVTVNNISGLAPETRYSITFLVVS